MLDMSEQALTIVFGMLCFIGGVFLVWRSTEYPHYCSGAVQLRIGGLLMAFVGGIGIIAATIICDPQTPKEKLASVETYYLDGEEVDADKIDIDLYDYTIKDDVCYLTGK